MIGPTTEELLRGHYDDLAKTIKFFTPEGREQSLALTNLGQSMLWALESLHQEKE